MEYLEYLNNLNNKRKKAIVINLLFILIPLFFIVSAYTNDRIVRRPKRKPVYGSIY